MKEQNMTKNIDGNHLLWKEGKQEQADKKEVNALEMSAISSLELNSY